MPGNEALKPGDQLLAASCVNYVHDEVEVDTAQWGQPSILKKTLLLLLKRRRHLLKMVNFGMAYGAGPRVLADLMPKPLPKPPFDDGEYHQGPWED